jgi:hypothetical protein
VRGVVAGAFDFKELDRALLRVLEVAPAVQSAHMKLDRNLQKLAVKD